MQGAPAKSHSERRQRNLSVGVDAHIDPAIRNCKIANTFGENTQRPVGADDPVRPWGNGKFAAMFRKNGCALCGESAASTPTNVVRICRGTFVFAGAYCRADRVVRPYGCVRVRIGTVEFSASYCAGGVEPRPYITTKRGGSSAISTLPLPVLRCARTPPPKGEARARRKSALRARLGVV